MKDKIVFIAHSYHKKTRSCNFLVDYLKEFYDIELLYDEEWETGKKIDWTKCDASYKAVIIWQMFPPKQDFNNITNENVIYFPMYDQVENWHFSRWYLCKDIKIISFSSTLYKKLKKWGFNSINIKYFIEPKEFSPGQPDEVFFWQRFTKININLVKKLFKNSNIKLHIHKALDPGKRFVSPSEKDEKNFQITYSEWFDNKDKMLDLLNSKGIYIAPRYTEGIGMSFLEAMAMGKLVIANDRPTMNEYIENGKTGFLCNFKHPRALKIKNIEQIQKNSFEFMKQGYEKWLIDRKRIIDFIQIPPKKMELNFFKKVLLPFLLFNPKKIIRFKLGSNASLTILGIKLFETE